MPGVELSAGMKFGKLTVTDVSEVITYPSGTRRERWLCKCDCGKELFVCKYNLLSGNSTSCGCTRIKKLKERRTTHGGSRTKLYAVWNGMKQRCTNQNSYDFQRYGGRGITVCDEWIHDYDSFARWAEQSGYHDGLSIDRIDVDRGYSPDNCRWANATEQANNRRNTILVTRNGETHTLSEWSKITGVAYDTLHNRLSSGWPVGLLLDTSKHKPGPKSS